MTGRHTAQAGGQSGVSVLQILIVVAVVAVVVALGLPAYMARAKQSLLQQNASTLELELKSYLAQGLDPTYVAVDDASASGDVQQTRSASEVFARALRGPTRRVSAFYVNPYDGSRRVACATALPAAGDGTPPAVWITDDQAHADEAFTPSQMTRDRLRGTLMVVFLKHDGQASGVDVYYVDGAGKRSPTAALLAF